MLSLTRLLPQRGRNNVRTALIAWYERRGYRLTGATLPFPFTETSGETTRDFHLAEMRKSLA